MDRWHRGRVVLVGDAAWCVTLMGGGGASLALIGGHVLAASLAAAGPGAPAEGFAAFERWMRPLASRVGSTPRALVRFAYPRTRLGLAARGVADRLVTATILRSLVQRLHAGKADDGALALPDLQVARA